MPSKMWTAAELMEMAPAERNEIFRASIVTDLSTVPKSFLDRVTARLEARIAAEDSKPA